MVHIYVALIEVRPLEGCSIDPIEYAGAAVRCYIPATDEASARSLLMLTLTEDRFELIEEEFFVREDLVEWEKPDSEEAEAAIFEAISTGEVVYSNFMGWDHDDPDLPRSNRADISN